MKCWNRVGVGIQDEPAVLAELFGCERTDGCRARGEWSSVRSENQTQKEKVRIQQTLVLIVQAVLQCLPGFISFPSQEDLSGTIQSIIHRLFSLYVAVA